MTRHRPNQITGKLPSVRCAIYTRKSSEEGLEQEFNSLDAQRESGEAYIRSQAGEGWTGLADRYDDGGFTGGNMDRPALKRLMADIEAGKIDCVVVYKVDRLSRSLLDFARMMEAFERHKVSFVSVTQQFNTASSMGRLVLNVLLSFAQFEREIISERTRDKIAATRRKGKWAVVDIGRPRSDKIVAILGEATEIQGERFRWRYPWDEAAIDGEPGSETFGRYVKVENGLSSDGDPDKYAINRFESHHSDVPDEEPEGIDGFGALKSLFIPGQLQNPGGDQGYCPRKAAIPILRPILKGVAVQMTAERDTRGGTVWCFQALIGIELVEFDVPVWLYV